MLITKDLGINEVITTPKGKKINQGTPAGVGFKCPKGTTVTLRTRRWYGFLTAGGRAVVVAQDWG